jgi:hypothetical protein
MNKTRINVANPEELLEIPGITADARDLILHHRAEHGPIRNASELASVLGRPEVDGAWAAEVDFDPADDTAPEAPGA